MCVNKFEFIQEDQLKCKRPFLIWSNEFWPPCKCSTLHWSEVKDARIDQLFCNFNIGKVVLLDLPGQRPHAPGLTRVDASVCLGVAKMIAMMMVRIMMVMVMIMIMMVMIIMVCLGGCVVQDDALIVHHFRLVSQSVDDAQGAPMGRFRSNF